LDEALGDALDLGDPLEPVPGALLQTIALTALARQRTRHPCGSDAQNPA